MGRKEKENDELTKRLTALQKERDHIKEQSRERSKRELERIEKLQQELDELRKKKPRS